MNTPIDAPTASVALLREAAGDRAGARVAARMAEVAALLGEDMVAVEEELASTVRAGTSPATDSAAHLLEAGGKRIRPLTVLLAAACFGPVPRAARDLAVVAELIHLATLLHDDVIDDGQERRGRLAPCRIWGNAVSVLAGDLLLTHALERTAAAAPHAVLMDLFGTLRRLVDGEVVQLRGRTRLDLHEEVYFQIVNDKTASLFVWAARAGASASGAPQSAIHALGQFGSHVGVAFQLVDDILDYEGDPDVTGKALLVDLVEGKVTLPLIRTLQARPSIAVDVDAARLGDRPAAIRVAQAVSVSGSCGSVRALARERTVRALAALEVVPASSARDLLAGIARELASRAG